jgi:hypothetical protein
VKITIKKRRKTITVTEITFDGIVLPDDGVELLSEALDADGMFNAIVINNSALRTALEKKGYINTNSRGGSYGTPKLRKAFPELLEALS